MSGSSNLTRTTSITGPTYDRRPSLPGVRTGQAQSQWMRDRSGSRAGIDASAGAYDNVEELIDSGAGPSSAGASYKTGYGMIRKISDPTGSRQPSSQRLSGINSRRSPQPAFQSLENELSSSSSSSSRPSSTAPSPSGYSLASSTKSNGNSGFRVLSRPSFSVSPPSTDDVNAQTSPRSILLPSSSAIGSSSGPSTPGPSVQIVRRRSESQSSSIRKTSGSWSSGLHTGDSLSAAPVNQRTPSGSGLTNSDHDCGEGDREDLSESIRTINPRTRPSLLTSQILSSPAVPQVVHASSRGSSFSANSKSPSTRTSVDMTRHDISSVLGSASTSDLSRKESWKDRVKGHLHINLGHHQSMPHLPPGSTSTSGQSSPSVNTAGSSSGGALSEAHRNKGKSRELAAIGLDEDVANEYYGGAKTIMIDTSIIRSRTLQRMISTGQVQLSAESGAWSAPPTPAEETRSPQDEEDAVIETDEIEVTRHRSGRKMINQYIILEEIGRGQHGQVRLGAEEVTSREPSRNPSSNTIDEHPSITTSSTGSSAQDTTPTEHLWAIKIVDRQAKKKLPGFKRTIAGPHGPEAGAQIANEKLRREIAILKKCRHPNVVRLREVIDSPVSKKIYLILEYCEGGEVKWQSEDGQPLLTVGEARKIMRDVICGLEYLHHQGIIHRDIKPANLLYSSDGTIKISDFGVSHYSHVLRAAGEDGQSPEDEEPAFMDEQDLAKTAGSPAFFAPELCYNGFDIPLPDSNSQNLPSPAEKSQPDFRFRVQDDTSSNRLSVASSHSGRPESPGSAIFKKNRPPITKAIDLWALGVTLYCFLFGKVPFDSSSEYALFNVIPTQDFAVPEFMGRDKMPTGGRFGYKKGPHGDLTQEACEVLDLLDKLLDKDPLTRIKLEDVKRHAFILRGLSDRSAWLAKTDPGMNTYVTVSNDEVAAAVTNTRSFRARMKKGLQTTITSLSNKFWQKGKVNRSRSNSTMPHQPDSGPATAAATPSRRLSLRADQAGHREEQPAIPSPRQSLSLSRKLSGLGPDSAAATRVRSRSPLLPHSPGLPDEFGQLGRSVSDKSTASSGMNQQRSLGRTMPARRQSAYLPNTIVSETSPMVGHVKSRSASNSTDELDAMIRESLTTNGTRMATEDNRSRSRQRALSNASSGGHSSAGGLRSGFGLGRLISRGFSQKSSHSSQPMSTSQRSHGGLSGTSGVRRYVTPSDYALTDGTGSHDDQDHSQLVGNLRARKSVETIASSLYSGSQVPDMSSPEIQKPQHLHAPPNELLPPLKLSIPSWDGSPPGSSQSKPLDSLAGDDENASHLADAEEADWDGSISDDDDGDYGHPVRSSEFDRLPMEGDSLRYGSWRLDGSGWRGLNGNAMPPVNSSIPSTPQYQQDTAALGLSIGELGEKSSMEPNFGHSASEAEDDTPVARDGKSEDTFNFPTITMPPAVNQGLRSPRQVNAAGNFGHTQQPSYGSIRHVPASPVSPVYPVHPEFSGRRRSLPRNSPVSLSSPPSNAHRLQDRAKSPLGRTAQLHDSLARVALNPDHSARSRELYGHGGHERNAGGNEEQEEEEEDEEEEGLDINIGKRGRRGSKPLSPFNKLKDLPA